MLIADSGSGNKLYSCLEKKYEEHSDVNEFADPLLIINCATTQIIKTDKLSKTSAITVNGVNQLILYKISSAELQTTLYNFAIAQQPS